MSVHLEGVSFQYPSSDKPALHNITLEISSGEVVLVTGKLGSGCSTLLLTIAGLAPQVTGGAREGSVMTLGHDPASPEGREVLAGRIGLLFSTPWTQLSGMSFSVRDEVAFGPANLGWSRERIAESVDRALALVDGNQLASREPSTLSGGELQRVMFAAVAAMEPELYLLDEPALELDPESALALYSLLPSLAKNACVIVATTDLDRAVDVADRVLLVERGQVVADGAARAVLGNVAAVEMGCTTTVAEIAHAAGCAPLFPLTVETAVREFAP